MTETNETDDRPLAKRIGTQERAKATLDFAEHEIERLGDETELPDSTVELSTAIYKRAIDTEIIENRSIATLTAATLYAACRVIDEGVSLKRITAHSSANHTIVQRCVSKVASELELELGLVDPRLFVPRLREELGLSFEVEHKSVELLTFAMEKDLLTGRSPSGYAAAAIYASSLLCNERVTQAEVAEKVGISTETISKRYAEVLRERGGQRRVKYTIDLDIRTAREEEYDPTEAQLVEKTY